MLKTLLIRCNQKDEVIAQLYVKRFKFKLFCLDFNKFCKCTKHFNFHAVLGKLIDRFGNLKILKVGFGVLTDLN